MYYGWYVKFVVLYIFMYKLFILLMVIDKDNIDDLWFYWYFYIIIDSYWGCLVLLGVCIVVYEKKWEVGVILVYDRKWEVLGINMVVIILDVNFVNLFFSKN